MQGGLGKHPSMPSYHSKSTSSTAALKPPRRRYRCFAAAHQHLESNTCKRMPLFRGNASTFVGIQTTSKPRAQRPLAPPLPSQLRQGWGVFIASASTLRPLAHLFLSLLRLTWRWRTKAKTWKQTSRMRRAAPPYECHLFACEFVQFVSPVLVE